MASVTITVADYIADTYNHADTVTIVDTAANLGALTDSQIANLVINGVEFINSSNDVISWDVGQWQSVPTSGLGFDVDDLKVVYDTGASIATLTVSDLGHLNTYGVTQINPSDGALDISADQYHALGGISIDADSDTTLVDTGADIAGLSAAEFGAMSVKGIDVIDASDDALSLTVDQIEGLGGVTVDASDVFTLSDTSGHIEALTVEQIAAFGEAGVDIVDATDDVLSLTVAQGFAGFAAGMELTDADVVTVFDTGANIAAVDASDLDNLGSDGFDIIDASDDVLSLRVDQALALLNSGVALTAEDAVTLNDTGANIAALGGEDFFSLGEFGVDVIDASDDAVSLSINQLGAISEGGIVLTSSDVVTLSDTGANIDALTSTDISNYGEQGVDIIDASDNVAYSTDVAAAHAILSSGITFAANDTVTLADTGSAIGELSAADFSDLGEAGYDIINATDDAISLTVAQVFGLGELSIDASDVVTLLDTAANIEALTVGQIAALGAAGVDIVDSSDDTLSLTVAQGFAGFAAGMELTDADDVTIYDTGANIAAVDASDLDNLGDDGFDHIDASDDVLNLRVDQANALLGSGADLSDADDVVTLKDTGAALAAVSGSDYTDLGVFGVDAIDASDDAVSLSINQLDSLAEAGVDLTQADVVTLSDLGASINELGASNFTQYGEQGVDIIDASDNAAYDTDVASGLAVLAEGIVFAADDTVTLADTGAAIAALTASQIGDLADAGYDNVDASDDALTLSLAQLDAFATAGLDLADADTVTAADTSTNLEALSAAQILAYGEQGVDIVDATDDVLHLTVAQGFAGFAAGMELTDADEVTVLDTGANIADVSASDMANLGDDGFDHIDASNDVLYISVAQANALEGSGVDLSDADDEVIVHGDDTVLGGLSAGDITGYGEYGIDFINAEDTTGTVNVAQASAAAGEPIAFTGLDTWTLSDTAANISGLSASTIGAIIADGVDIIDASDNTMSLSVDQYLAAAGHLTLADTITLADTGAAIQGLTAVQFAALAGNGIDRINATDNVLALTVAQFSALGAVTLAGGDTVTIKDTGAHFLNLDFSSLAGKNVDALDSTDNVLALTVAQFLSLGSVSLAAGDVVTLTDTSANINAMTPAQLVTLGGKGVDVIDSTDNVLNLTLTQFNNLGSVALTAADVVTVSATGAQVAVLGTTKLAQMNTAHVDFLDVTDTNASVSVAQISAMGSMKFVANDVITLADTDANVAALSTSAIAALAGQNVDKIDASDDTLHLSVAQIGALGTVTLASADYVTEADAGALIAAQSNAALSGLYAKGVDQIDATDDTLNLTVSKFLALNVFAPGAGPSHTPIAVTSIVLTGADTVTLLDTGANLAGLTATQLGNLEGQQVDFLDSSTDLLTLNLNQFQALGEVGLTGADVVTIADTGATLGGLSVGDVSIMASKGIDRIDATDNKVTLTKAVVDALISGNIALTATDKVTMNGGEASLEALSAGQLATYAAKGVDIINSGTDVLSLDAAQVSAMVNTGLKVIAGDDVTLRDTGANVIANLGALFGNLASTGIDHIDLADDTIDLTVAQALSFGIVHFDESDDNVAIVDDSSAIEALTAEQIFALGYGTAPSGPIHTDSWTQLGLGVDILDASDDQLTLSFDQVGAAYNSGIALTADDVVTMTASGAQLSGSGEFGFQFLNAIGIDNIDVTDDALTVSVVGAADLQESSITLAAEDVVTLADTGAHLAALTAAQINGLSTLVDAINVTDDAISLKLNQFNAFTGHGLTFGAEDTVSVSATNAANTMTGGAEHDVFSGQGGNDVLNGGGGSDTLIGGTGSDNLTGGLGNDTFQFNKVADSTAGAADRITDLTNTDTIDLSRIDANTNTGGNQAFVLVDHFSGTTAGELTIKYSAGNNQTVIKMDVNGDGVSDGQIVVSGDHHDFTHFVL